MWDRFLNSFELARTSLAVLRKDKELVAFPIISGLLCLLVSASFIVPAWRSGMIGGAVDSMGEETSGITGYGEVAGLFLFYFCNYFVIIFCNTGLIGAAMIRLRGGDPTVGDGIRIAFSRIGPIFRYSVIAATVGVVLRLVEQRASWLGKIVVSLLGTAWSLATYLIVPVMVHERLGAWASLKRSASLLRETWGEQIMAGFAIWWVLLPLAVLGLLPIAAFGLALGSPNGWAIGIAVALVYWVLLGVVGAAMHGVYTAAVYLYTTQGEAPAGFDAGLVENAFQPKS